MAIASPTRRTNVEIMNAIRNDLGSEYAQRITPATADGMRETARNIMSYKPFYNDFVDALVNRIGTTMIQQTLWSNPLAPFKRGMLEFGDTIQEIKAGLVHAKQYDPSREVLEREIFGREEPHVEANYHTRNRQDYYKITVAEEDMKAAFLSSTGLFDLVSALLNAPVTTDQYDEFMLMCQLFAQYENNGGYYRVNVPDARTLEASPEDSKMVLKKVRAMASELTFMSPKYNAAKMYSHANREDLLLLGTPQFFANVDVDALAGAFNIDRMAMAGRQIAIPEDKFGIDGAQAILTTKDYFVVADTLLENRSADNPVGLHRNHFLHHHQIISQSRFVPAVLFHTGADDSAPIEIRPATGVSNITIQRSNGDTVGTTGAVTVARGERVYASATATGDGEAQPTDPNVSWSITGGDDPRTRITRQGTVHVGPRETASTLTVTARATFIDPADPNAQVEATRTRALNVDPDSPIHPEWPVVRDDAPGDPDEGDGEPEA